MLEKDNTLLKKLITNNQYHFCLFLIVLVLLTLLMIISCEPVSQYGGHDYFFHMRRLNALIDSFRDGTFPSYIDYTAALNFGYLSGVFYSDFTLVPFAIVGLFTNAVFAYSFLLFSITILSGLFTYMTVNKIYKNTFAASVSALLYTFAPYRMYDLYHRGALGESIALTFTPIVILGLYYIIKGDYKKWYVFTIGFCLIIYTHAISSLLMFITTVFILLFYIKPLIKEPKRILYLALSTVVALIILAYYIYPMIEQSLAIDFNFKDNPINLPQYKKFSFRVIAWGFVSGIAYPHGAFFSGIGALLTISICLRLFVREKSAKIRSVDIGVIIGLIYIVASSRITPWESFPFTLIRSIQFPSRLYGYTNFFFALAGGYYLSRILKSNKSKLIGYIIVIIASIVVVSIHSDNYRYLLTVRRANTNKPEASTFFHLYGSEFMPTRIQGAEFIENRTDLISAQDENTVISNFEKNRNKTYFNVKVNSTDTLELPLTYYLGYSVKLNNTKIATTESKYGLVQIPVDQSGRVEVYYAGTTIQKVSFYITLISIFVLCIYIYLSRKRKA